MEEDTEPAATVSIVVRLRRTILEEVHVRVLVTDELVVDEPDGSAHLDGGKVFAAALRLGAEAGVEWRQEGEPVIEIHPVQTPPPDVSLPDPG